MGELKIGTSADPSELAVIEATPSKYPLWEAVTVTVDDVFGAPLTVMRPVGEIETTPELVVADQL